MCLTVGLSILREGRSVSHGLDEVQSGKDGVCLEVWTRYSLGRSECVSQSE